MNKALYGKYHLPPIGEYPFGEKDWWETFLIQSNSDTLRALEENLLGKKGNDFTELLSARAEAREALEKLKDGET